MAYAQFTGHGVTTQALNEHLVANHRNLVHSQHSFPPVSAGFPAGCRISGRGSIPERLMAQFFSRACCASSLKSVPFLLSRTDLILATKLSKSGKKVYGQMTTRKPSLNPERAGWLLKRYEAKTPAVERSPIFPEEPAR